MEPFELLERELQEWSGMPHVVCCSSGTAALHLALEAMRGQNRGTRVILGDFNMIAVPRAVSLAGMEPIFVDCDSDLCINTQKVDEVVWDIDRANMFGQGYAIIATHIYGRQCKMDDLANSATDCLYYLIEDLAEAHGVNPHPQTDAACWSFFKNKIIAGEEGGAVGFRDPKHAALARQLRSLGFTDDHDFVHVPRGCNYRLSNANAEVIRRNWGNTDVQGYVNIATDRRREIESWYDELCPAEYRMPPRDAPWVYDLRVPGMSALRQTELVRAIQADGIAARHAFKPCHTQAEYRHCPVYGSGNAAVASREVVYLPLTPGQVTRESARRAFEVIGKVLR